MAKNKNAGKPRNYTLASGVYRFGRSKTYHKKAIYKFLKKKTPKKVVKVKPTFIEKKIGGVKNGGTRKVRVNKLKNDYPTIDRPTSGKNNRVFSKHVRRVRSSLAPGVIAIVLAGIHKGKRVIILKKLDTGLLLITGPYRMNGCPLRRINQRYLLATSTNVDISSVKVPANINDAYFRRIKAVKKEVKKDGDVFDSKKEVYKVSEERKKDQATVDNMVVDAIKKHKMGSDIKQYLRRTFSLSKGQYPHAMKF